MNTEIWHKCEVPFTRYEVSNLGRVRNAHTGLVLRQRKSRKGYLDVLLQYKGQTKRCYIHKLVAIAFVEGWREGLEVNHKNGVKTDNRVENLEWVTHSQNQQHASDVLLLDVKPVALLDERGHLQWLFNSARACSRMMGGNVQEHIRKKFHYHGFRPRYISVPMYREIVHLVNVHHYTLHSAWIEANINGAYPQPLPKGKGEQSAVGADYLPQPLRKEGSKTVCPNNTQPATQTGKGNQNYQLSTINYQLSDEA